MEYESNFTDNNYAKVVGKLVSNYNLDHEINGEKFYGNQVEVERLSGTYDIINILCSEYLMVGNKGDYVCINGQFRSHNYIDNNGNSHLKLFVFVKDMTVSTNENQNEVYLKGTICSKPSIRTTPKGKVITDILIAVNRPYGKSDYIPCIAWGLNAKRLSNNNIGDMISVKGRLQSREYLKDDIVKTAYEASITSILS